MVKDFDHSSRTAFFFLSESALKELSKDEVIALALEYQKKFDSTSAN